MNHPRLSIIPARAATDRSLKPRDLQVLCVLGRHTDDLGWCRRSQVKMAQEMDCARSTVFESISRLVDTGYLERHVQETDSGRDSAHIYRVILDPVHPDPASIPDADDPCRYIGTPAGISAPPAGPESAPPAGSGPAPINDPSLTTPSNLEREGEREGSGKENKKGLDRSFWKLINGWLGSQGMPSAEARNVWGKLGDEDRYFAQIKRDPWFRLLKSQGKKHIPGPSTYLKERLWEAVPDEVDTPTPERIDAAPFGCLWSIERFRQFLSGSSAAMVFTFIERELMKADPNKEAQLRRDKQVKLGWPQVNRMHDLASQRTGFTVSSDLEQFKSLMEAVPVDSAMWHAWKRCHEENAWPWLPDPGGQRVVYFPVGGPDGLDNFKNAVLGKDHDGN